MLEYRNFYGKCEKYNKNASIEVEIIVDQNFEKYDYAKSKIRHCPLDPNHECKRSECLIWNNINF